LAAVALQRKEKAMGSRIAFMLLATTIVAAPALAQTENDGVKGMWQGTVDRGGAQAQMVLRLAQTEDGWKGRADVAGTSSPITKVQIAGDHVRFSVKGQGTFDGTYSQNSLVGSFSGSKKGKPPGSVSLTRQVESEDEMNSKIDAIIDTEGP
jgi:hypothetical protein